MTERDVVGLIALACLSLDLVLVGLALYPFALMRIVNARRWRAIEKTDASRERPEPACDAQHVNAFAHDWRPRYARRTNAAQRGRVTYLGMQCTNCRRWGHE